MRTMLAWGGVLGRCGSGHKITHVSEELCDRPMR